MNLWKNEEKGNFENLWKKGKFVENAGKGEFFSEIQFWVYVEKSIHIENLWN
jgi:hypothetical protein